MPSPDPDTLSPRTTRQPTPPPALDAILTAQFMVAWAGERGDEDALRLGWWETDLVWTDGNEILRDLFPHTHEWAMFQAIREAARRRDAALRGKAARADRLLSLFHLGFDTDERLEARLQHLKRQGISPHEALPELAGIRHGWDREGFLAWVAAQGEARYTAGPTGRQLQGMSHAPAPEALVRHLVAALSPLSDDYPLPHLRLAP